MNDARRTDDSERSPATILMVDDDLSARELVARLLKKLNLANPVRVAEDGDQAIAVLSAEDAPALVLLDLDMPNRSGLDVLAWLRAEPRLSAVPVIMLTGSAELDEVDRAYALGIASYLVKPVGFTALRDVLGELGLPWMLMRADRRDP